MISNFHQSSGPYENSPSSSSYYTFDEPSPPAKGKKSTKTTTTTKSKKKKGRIFGLGKPKKETKSTDLGDWRPPQHVADDNSSTFTGGGQSLTYSTSAASYQTTGESTDSSGGAFGEILKLLDEEDQRELLEKRKQQQQQQRSSSDRSVSSLAYSEGGTTLNYSEDGDQSYLHGTKLLGMLGESSSAVDAAAVVAEEQEQQAQPRMYPGAKHQATEEPFVMSPNKTPVADNKSQSRRSRTRDHSLRRERTAVMTEDDEDPVSSSSPWLCGIDLGDAGAALRPFLCF